MKKKHTFKHFDLVSPEPEWNSELSILIFELEELRTKKLFSKDVPPYIFFQLKEIFHTLESLGSARIEGNRTTLAEYVEKKIDGTTRRDESSKEIDNIQQALKWIHDNIKGDTRITRAVISDLHILVTKELTPPPDGEGSNNPGELRKINPTISGSDIILPDFTQVVDYFNDLLDFVNMTTEKNNDLLITAVAHHRFAWIHPFDNGNGRLVRLLTYLMLIRQGFKVKQGSILNPAAIFCMDREKYYSMLSKADTGSKEALNDWCVYVLSGLKREIEKIDQLLDQKYLVTKILLPVFNISLENKLVTDVEHKILSHIVKSDDMTLKAGDLATLIGENSPLQRSRIIARLKYKRMLMPLSENGRQYTVAFANSHLLRAFIEVLTKEKFVTNIDKIS